jgi:hypothetical protein
MFDIDIIIAAFHLSEIGDKDGFDTLAAFGYEYNDTIQNRIKREITDIELSKIEIEKLFGGDQQNKDNSSFFDTLAKVENKLGRQIDVEDWTCQRWISTIKNIK